MPTISRQKYHWLAVKTGATGIKETDDEMTLYDFLILLNRWNEMGAGRWQYWAA